MHQKGFENPGGAKPQADVDAALKVWHQLNKSPETTLKEMRQPAERGPNNPGISSLPGFKLQHEGGGRSISTIRGAHDGFGEAPEQERFQSAQGFAGRAHKLPGSSNGSTISTRDGLRGHPGEDPAGHLPRIEVITTRLRATAGDHPAREKPQKGEGSTVHPKPEKGEPPAPEKERTPRGAHEPREHGAKNHRKGDGNGEDKDEKLEDKKNHDKGVLEIPELKEGKFSHPHVKPDHPGPYVKGAGVRNPLEDPELNDLGHAIINAEKTSDNFQLMKAVKGLSDDQLRNEAERAQSVINRDLGHPSVRIGVDDDNIHIYFKRTDLTLPYNAANDKKEALDTTNPNVRNQLVERLRTDVGPAWGQGVTELSTPELAMFDALSRSDGPALRSAMSGIKNADQLEEHFQHIAKFANSRGISNWGNVIWSNDLTSLTVYNGTSVYTGKVPIDTKPAT